MNPVAKVVDDQGVLLAFYDCPGEHWIHLRTTNPIIILSFSFDHGRELGCRVMDTVLDAAARGVRTWPSTLIREAGAYLRHACCHVEIADVMTT